MDKKTLLKQWLHEQKIAHIKGWDFSHIRGRYREEDDLPWDFGSIIKSYLRESDYCWIWKLVVENSFIFSIKS